MEKRCQSGLKPSCHYAAKFTRQGSITINGGISKDRSRIFLAVQDTGLGIPKDKFHQIFGAFEQVRLQLPSVLRSLWLTPRPLSSGRHEHHPQLRRHRPGPAPRQAAGRGAQRYVVSLVCM